MFTLIPSHAPFAAASMSASSKMMCGDLPPSSRVTGISRLAAAIATRRPVSTEPGEHHLADEGMFDQGGARHLAEPRDDVEDAGRDPALKSQPRELKAGQRSLLGGLGHDGVAHHQRGGDAPGGLVDRARSTG